MVNYQNGKIYKITSQNHLMCYVGSTTKKYLSQRLEKHRSDYKDYLENKPKSRYYASYEILAAGDAIIEWLEDCKCNSKDELRAREQHYINLLDCVNKRKAFRTNEEVNAANNKWRIDNKEKYKEIVKEYYQKNKEMIQTKAKIYREVNKEKIATKQKEYREANKEKTGEYREARKEYNKEYREKNKETIAAKRKEYREANKELIAAKKKAYREANKDVIAAKAKAKREAKNAINKSPDRDFKI